jgi:hypothetical protein
MSPPAAITVRCRCARLPRRQGVDESSAVPRDYPEQRAIEDKLGWLFRAQPTEDYGIDAHAEVVDGEEVIGKLLALQIKAGTSWFSEPGPAGWWFRPDAGHVQYWKDHSLPVVVVLYHPETGRCHWQRISQDNLIPTPTGGWKLLVPEAHVLDDSARTPLQAAAEGDPYELRLRELRLAKPWMEMLANGVRLVVDYEEWINKTSGRGSVSIGIDHEDGNGLEKLVTWHFFPGPASYAEAVPKLFAWTDAKVHEETYDDGCGSSRGTGGGAGGADVGVGREWRYEMLTREPGRGSGG